MLANSSAPVCGPSRATPTTLAKSSCGRRHESHVQRMGAPRCPLAFIQRISAYESERNSDAGEIGHEKMGNGCQVSGVCEEYGRAGAVVVLNGWFHIDITL